ncbi:MAG: serine/threonine-protein kinase [Arenicellales bacterium]
MAHRHAEFALDLPGYEILTELGRGGVSTVHLARHELLDRRVAIKIMSPVLAVEEGFNKRFIREGQTVAQLKHPGIVTVYDVAVVNHRPYIAMEYLPGGSLKDRMKAPMEPGRALALLRSINDSLGCAHRAGVFHRDVKPENILFRENGDPVLTDFGIAKSESQDTAFTSVGIVVGTPRYISPEQAQGQGCDARSDIYALGVILYEMLTGRPPFDVKGSMSLLYAHINDPIPRLPEELSACQELLDDLMAKDPDQRIADCTTLASRLDELELDLHTGRLADASRGTNARRSGRGYWSLVVLVGLVLPATLLLLWSHGYRFTFEASPGHGPDLKKMVSRLLAPAEAPPSMPVAPAPRDAPPPVPQPTINDVPVSGGPPPSSAAAGTAPKLVQNNTVKPAAGQDWDYKAASVDHMSSTVRSYEEAAEQGHATSEFYLGVAYGNGDGVERNEDRALYWLTRASTAGVRDAKYNLVLGNIFGSRPNLRAAAKLALELADQKYAPVYPILGWMYNTGTGVDSSFVQSVRWNMKTALGDVTGRAGPPEKVVRQWERQMQAALSKIRSTSTAQPDIVIR